MGRRDRKVDGVTLTIREVHSATATGRLDDDSAGTMVARETTGLDVRDTFTRVAVARDVFGKTNSFGQHDRAA